MWNRQVSYILLQDITYLQILLFSFKIKLLLNGVGERVLNKSTNCINCFMNNHQWNRPIRASIAFVG